MGTQPGLLALFLSLKQHRPTDSNSQKKEMIGPDSCLYPVLTMIDPDKQVHLNLCVFEFVCILLIHF